MNYTKSNITSEVENLGRKKNRNKGKGQERQRFLSCILAKPAYIHIVMSSFGQGLQSTPLK
jgi:hypothetical protein